jgi:hypothetical protein
LNTHVAKCAIAASSVITLPSRPNLATVLTKIGFKVDENNTSDPVKECWKGLSAYKVADHNFDASDRELELFESHTGTHLLQIDKRAFEALVRMHPASENSQFVLPCAWINFGANPLADGLVTFFHTRCSSDGNDADTGDCSSRGRLSNN